MYKPVKFITKIPYKDFSTYYLFNKKSKILVPIETSNEKSYEFGVPSIYNTIKRVIKGAGFSILGVKIYHYDGNIFYTYLSIKNESRVLDINISFKDGIEISKETFSPIYVNEKILKSCGIEITKELVIKALKDSG